MASPGFNRTGMYDWMDSEGFEYHKDSSGDWWIKVGGTNYRYKADYKPGWDFDYDEPMKPRFYGAGGGSVNTFSNNYTVTYTSGAGGYASEFPSSSPYIFTHEKGNGKGDLVGYNQTGSEIYRHRVSSLKSMAASQLYSKGLTYSKSAEDLCVNTNVTNVKLSAGRENSSMSSAKKRPMDWLDNEINKTRLKARECLNAI